MYFNMFKACNGISDLFFVLSRLFIFDNNGSSRSLIVLE